MSRAAWRAAGAAAIAAMASFGGASPRAAASDAPVEAAELVAPVEPAGAVGAIDQAAGCGKPGQPPCPLQAWMRANVAGPLAGNDFDALATGLGKAAKLSPDPAWASWSTVAEAGAAAAKKSDLPGVRAACKSCHDSFRDAYRARYRTRPVPR